MTDPTTTTRDGDVLSAEEQRACWAAILTRGDNCHDSPLLPYKHTAAADAVTLLKSHIASLQRLLDAAEQRAEEACELLEWHVMLEDYWPDVAPHEQVSSARADCDRKIRAFLTEQEPTDA